MTDKDFVNFPIKLERELHDAIRLAAFTERISIHKAIQNALKDKYLAGGEE